MESLVVRGCEDLLCPSVVCHHDLLTHPLGHTDIRKQSMINFCEHRIVTFSMEFIFRGHCIILKSYNFGNYLLRHTFF